jgi:2-iminobutanoate/2-iminopropanoate deaminase
MSSSREIVSTSDAPAAIGPYSQAVKSAGLLFCSGQIPLDPGTGEIVGETAAEQAGQCLRNLEALVSAGGADLANAIKVTVYMTDLSEFANVNEVYATFFEGGDPPARVAVGVSALPRGSQVEIDAIVALFD